MHALDTRVPAQLSATHVVGAVDAAGLERRPNRVLYVIPRGRPTSLEAVAFPGDGVAWPEWVSLAGAHGPHPHSAGLLGVLYERLQREGGAYTDAALYVVEPAGMAEHFAVYENLLVGTTASGEPVEGYIGRKRKASAQLEALIEAEQRDAAQRSASPDATAGGDGVGAAAGAPPPPLVAFGFSKGGVVLNQLLAELAGAPDDGEDAGSGGALLRRLRELHYLDCGLHCRGAYLTQHDAIEALGRRRAPPTVCMHVTPRQADDPSRRWLEQERKRSVDMLRKAGVPTAERMYFEGEPLSLAMHFGCVQAFEPGLAADASVAASDSPTLTGAH